MVKVKVYRNKKTDQLSAVLPKSKFDFIRVKGIPKFVNLKEEDFEYGNG